jgi:hypothetical protein
MESRLVTMRNVFTRARIDKRTYGFLRDSTDRLIVRSACVSLNVTLTDQELDEVAGRLAKGGRW